MNPLPGSISVRWFILSLEFLTSQARWQEIYERLPEFAGKIYYSYAYHGVCNANGDGKPAALFYSSGTCQIFYPFLMRPVPAVFGGAGYFDLETAYGYGGPQTFNATEKDLIEFKSLFANWSQQQNVVAEFVRFNPLTGMHDQFADFYRVSHNRVTVSINMNQEFAGILRDCTPPRQRNWRTAGRKNLSMRELPDLDIFASLYQKTMQRLQARPYYLFSQAYFKAVEKIAAQNRFFAGVFTEQNELAAAAIFLLDGEAAHYHLGASDDSFRDTQANTFLMLEFARLIAAAGQRKVLHLGGGLSLAEADPLFRFKAGFSPQRNNFFIGRRVHQTEAYEDFSQRWQQHTGCRPDILLHYHYGANDENL